MPPKLSCEPRVSIVISSFNYARFLEACIESALGQRHTSMEVIVVDDGSTDDSRGVIAAYAGRIRAVHKPNAGQASSMNVGFARARGDIVIFLDADDALAPTTAGRVAAALATQPDLAKIEYPLAVVDADGRPTGVVNPPPHVPLRSGDLREYELTAPFDMVWMAPSGTAYSRRVLDRIMPIPVVYRDGGADWYLAHISSLYGPVLFLPEVGGFYRVHGDNAFASSALDLQRVSHTIDVMRRTGASIRATAHNLGLRMPRDGSGELLSFTYVAQRLILLRLGTHPAKPRDSAPRLIWLGVKALRRRRDVRPMLKAGMLAWLVAMAVARRPAAVWLAERMLFSDLRPAWVNRGLTFGHVRHFRGKGSTPSRVN